ncbi:bile acid:sodium symporter family protein [Neobacillus cucumis]|uniref:bile acid:sodium symporter family protein n=1 Tax=Neobacillus cucumis TaxID=1740721 RepID=UPI0018E0340A|nr:bile acid:sodium symporter family protein [Neobacillus cucumis]MBI0578789.1 bile acid:sodium symporter family protein [Neobacillus cucumis]WHY92597.1 bile acid:sodium symporter family protein [Neobacillus cucumis]
MLQRLNKQLEKILPLITPVSVILGVLFSVYLKDFSYLIPWLFAFMTFSGSLSSNFKSLTEVITHPFPVFLAMCILHVFMPLWAWGVGHVAFYGDDFTVTGLILAMVIPTGVTSFIWVSIYKGNIPMTLSIILVDTLLSPLIVPYSISLFMGQKIDMDFISIMKGLFGMVVLPSLIGMFLNQVTKGRIKDQLGSKLAPFSKICMGVVVMLNGSVVAPYLRHIHLKLVLITLVVFFIALTGYLFSFLLGRFIKSDRDTVITLTFTGGMRNISAGAVIAVSYFPAAVAVPVVVGMLFQQILASLNGYFLNKYYDKKIEHHDSKSVAV